MAERFHCFHCDEDLDYRAFTRHREEFYDQSTNTWQQRFVLSESDSDHDGEPHDEQPACSFSEINSNNNSLSQPQAETQEELFPDQGRSSVPFSSAKFWVLLLKYKCS